MPRSLQKVEVTLLFFLVGCALLSGCDSGWGPSLNVIAKVPSDFQETPGTSRIAPLKEIEHKENNTPRISVYRAPKANDPLLGAVLRLDQSKAVGREEYRDFLLPQIILSSFSEHPVALTAKFGGVAEDVRVIVPAGDFYVGLLPVFSMVWLGGITSGGEVNVDMSVEGRWSRLRADDSFLKVNFTVTPPLMFPEKNLNPLVISAIDTEAGGLPERPVIKEGDFWSWAEIMFYELIFLTQKTPKDDAVGKGLISLRSVEKVIENKDPSSTEMTLVWASLALRDNVPSWIAFIKNDTYLFLGALPPDKNAFVLSPKLFIKNGGVTNFSEFLKNSRSAYVDSVLKGEDASFLDTRDRFLFSDLRKPEAKKVQGGEKTKSTDFKNPFDSRGS